MNGGDVDQVEEDNAWWRYQLRGVTEADKYALPATDTGRSLVMIQLGNGRSNSTARYS